MKTTLEVKLKDNYPGLWSLLNKKAQASSPPGIIEYLTKKDYQGISWQSLRIPEKYINQLIIICGVNKVADAYRRDLSSVTDENAFLNFTHEIIACSSMAALNPDIGFRPKSGKGKCDLSLPVEDVIVYGEVKRWPDNYLLKNPSEPKRRLIFKLSADSVNSDIRMHRSMELYGKLIEATRQFSEGNINVIFLFTPTSVGDVLQPLQQALFGNINYSREPDKVTLEADGFFATTEAKVVAACYACDLEVSREIFVFRGSWQNPEAIVSLPSSVATLFKRYDISNLIDRNGI